MHDATDQPDPFDRLRAALGKCRPDETPLRDLVIATLRKDGRMLEEIADADEPSSEGSINTIRVFLSTETWPAEDHGWVDEALALSRYDYWYSKADRPSYATKADGIDRPNDHITLRVLCASVLLADSARHAPFSNNDTEPGAGTCLDIVDAACRLGGPWPEAASRFLADHALYITHKEDWDDGSILDGTRDIAVPLAILLAWRSVKEDARLPVRELFEAINELALHHGAKGWREPISCIQKDAPRVIKQTILDPVTDRLSRETREAIDRFCKRFIG